LALELKYAEIVVGKRQINRLEGVQNARPV
jgi:hypothetical protein